MAFEKAKRVMSIIIPWGMMFGTACMILIVGINGIPGRFMGSIFDVTTSDLSVPVSSFTNITGITISKSGNITATDLQLDDKYSFYLWDYSTTTATKTTFHKKGWDYIKNITISELSVDGNTTDLPSRYLGLKNSVRDKIRFSQAFFLPALLSTFIVLVFDVSGAFGFPVPLFVVSVFTGISLIATIVLAGLITALIFQTKALLQHLTAFGLIFTMGTSDLGVVWLATVHILVVGVMWLLMACRVIQYNDLLRQPSLARTPENHLLASDDDPQLDRVTPK
jgi:hypothetical protein